MPQNIFDTKELNELAQSDPELIANMRYFMESEVMQESTQIDASTRAKISLAAVISTQGANLFNILLDSMLVAESDTKDTKTLQNTPYITAIETKELIYQATPYIGLSKSLEFLNICNKMFKDKGIKLPLKSQQKITRAQRQEKGLETQRILFGDVIDKGNKSAPKDVQHIRSLFMYGLTCVVGNFLAGKLCLKILQNSC